MPGSATVLMSPSWSPSPATILRMIRRMIYTTQQGQYSCTFCSGGYRDATHLSRPGLRQIADDDDFLGRSKGPDDFPHLERELLLERRLVGLVVRELRLEGDEREHGLTRELVGGADDCMYVSAVVGQGEQGQVLTGGLGDTGVHDQRRLDLSGGKTMSRNVDNIYSRFSIHRKQSCKETHRQYGP